MPHPDARAPPPYQSTVSSRLHVSCRVSSVVVLIAPPLQRPGASWGSKGEIDMRYVVSWRERPTASAAEVEAARKRVVEAFSTLEKPKSLTIHHFDARVGLGGDGGVEMDEPGDLPYLATADEPACFPVPAVILVVAAVAGEERTKYP